jgi:SAM-dependent methyltransferase
MADEPRTWHYGLVARWWAEFNEADDDELAYFRHALDTFGQPALDLACGAGRLLLPLLVAGYDVDGVDVSPDMLARAAELAAAQRLQPALYRMALHELDIPRRYRTIYCCDSFGLGGRRDHDRLAFRRAFEHLETGGALVFNIYYPYDGMDPQGWSQWLPANRSGFPRDWPSEGDRRRASDGDEIELVTRTTDLDPVLQRRTLEIRAVLHRDGKVVDEEHGLLHENLYFAQELLLMLADAGFDTVRIEGRYTGQPAESSNTAVVFVARKPTSSD